MKTYSVKLTVILFFLASAAAMAQQYYFKNYSSESGMPFVQVNVLFQDKNGFLYAGGYGGLTRFDGKEFLNITTNQGLDDNYVNAICESESGELIIGTRKGINVFKNGRVQRQSRFGLAKGLNVLSLLQLPDGKLLAGTNRGLMISDKKGERFLENTEGLEIRDLLWVNETLYAATSKGLLMADKLSVKFLKMKDGLSSELLNTIAFDSLNKVLAIGTANGLNLYYPSSGKVLSYFIQNGLIDNTINCLEYNKDGGLWMGSPTGLMKLENDEFSYYNIYYDNNSNLIRCFLTDFENNLWVGTHSGLYRYRDNSFSTFDKLSGPGNAFIFEIFKHQNALYLCSENNGIYKYSDGYFKRYGMKDGLPSLACRAGAADMNGRLFFETDSGVVELKNDRFFPVTIPKSLVSSRYKLYCDSDNRVWIGGTNGVGWFRYSNGNKPDTGMVSLNSESGEFEVTDMCKDHKGRLWIVAFPGSLFLYEDGKVKDYGKQLGLKKTEFVSVRMHHQRLYVATLSGLYIIDPDKNTYKIISTADGLISDIIYAIGFSDQHKVLWIGTNIGISKLNVDAFERNGEIILRSFGKNDGFSGIECNSNGIFEDSDGTVWFGTVSGLIKHMPNELKVNISLSKTNIIKIKLGDSDTILQSGAKIRYSNNSITFYYRGICFTNPEKVKYAVMLDGYDKTYSTPQDDNYAKYSNLAPGTYTFKVVSCNNEGVWNNEPSVFVFKILTPFYKTWWFIVLSTAAIITAVVMAFKWRLQNIRKREQKEFDRKVEMSKVELKALRSQMNPHFVFNSLNSIQHYIFNSKSDEAVKYLNKFAKLMRVILNNSDKPTVAIEDDLEALKLYLELEQMRFEDKFDYRIEIEGNVDLDYDIMPPMLLQPYVENAILHGLTPKKEKGLLVIGIRMEGQFIVCTITDNGIGRKKAAEIKRTMPGSKHKSMGMKITEERLRILNDISLSQHSVKITDLEDDEGKAAGTRVEIYVPIV